MLSFTEPSQVYSETLAAVRADMAGADGRQEGDPDRAARIIVDLVHSPRVPLRLPLGAEAVQRLSGAYRRKLDQVQQWAQIATGADFAGMAASSRPI